MSLTDPLQSIVSILKNASTGLGTTVSILKNASTGLGTTGYEITKDDGSTDVTLLVTYTLAKEKLTALFGGSQDYDVIVTCKSGEAITEYIGTSTTVQRTPIIITIHVVEKHSATGSAKKIITPELVRWKCKEAVLAFVKAKVNAPGGSINVWKATGDRPEEDVSARPILYKYIVETETLIYR